MNKVVHITALERKARNYLRELYFEYKELVHTDSGTYCYISYARTFEAYQKLFPNLKEQETFERKWDAMWRAEQKKNR